MQSRGPADNPVLGEAERPSWSYLVDVCLSLRPVPIFLWLTCEQMKPPLQRPETAADSIPVKHLHSSLNKAKWPINVVTWTPEGRRLLTASSNGEFTLWNGMSFNFELLMTVRYQCNRFLISLYIHIDT